MPTKAKTEQDDVDPDALSAPLDPDGPKPGSPEAPIKPEDSNYPAEGRIDPFPVVPNPNVPGNVGSGVPSAEVEIQAHDAAVTPVEPASDPEPEPDDDE
jgi:hypothetical protein